ncbi:MAG TPA: helix-turn-helix transcriptional regulator [Rhizobiales bacterium]|nr:helix-turn-helix transcriptional regulator [Hyphomicrobiales bacterium]
MAVAGDKSTLEVLSAIYAAAADPGKWQDFCDILSRKAGAPVMLLSHNFNGQGSCGVLGGGYDPDYLESYHQYYAGINPWMKMIAAMPSGITGTSDQALAKHDLFRTEFYNDWLKPQDDIHGGPAVICHRGENTATALTMSCAASTYDTALERCFGLLDQVGSHVNRAITMSRALTGSRSGLVGCLSSLNHAVILVHRSGRVAFANGPGEAMLTSPDFISMKPGGMLTSPIEAVEVFLARTVDAIHRHDFAALPLPLAIRTTAFGVCMIHPHIFPAHAPLPFPASIWSDPVAGALVLTGKAGLRSKPAFRPLLQAFGATPAEIRLGKAVLEGMALTEYSSRNCLSHHTVRNQMRALLLKTGTRNQSAFILKMLRLDSPFVPPEL